MKRFSAALLGLFAVLTLFTACGKSADTGAPATVGYKVASHNAQIEGNPYRVVYENELAEAVEKYMEMGLISQFDSFTSNNDPALQAKYIEKTIDEGYDLILVNPIAADGLDPVIAKAAEKGVTYINVDSLYPSDDIINVTVDQEAYARMNVEWAAKELGAGKKVILFNGVDGNPASELRKAVYHQVLADAGIEIVREVSHGWDDAEARRQMAEILRSGVRFDGIINQEGAMGITDALEEAGAPWPACITSSEEVKWIRRIAEINRDEEEFPFIVVENPPGIGATALAVGLNLLQGHELKADVVSEYNNIKYTPKWVMTYDNMEEQLRSISKLEDSTSISNYMMVDEARKAYFTN